MIKNKRLSGHKNRSVRLYALLFMLCISSAVVADAVENNMDMTKLECLIEPRQLVEISSEVPGVLASVKVGRGDVVKKGQILARLESGVEKARVNVARVKAEFNKRKLDRNDSMYKKELISLQERDEVETEWRVSMMELEEARQIYEQRQLRSPVNGRVVKKNTDAGEFTGDESIFTLARLDELYVELVVPVEYYGRFRIGEMLQVFPQKPVGGEYAGKIIVIDPLIDAGSGTFGIRVLLPNPEQKIPAGIRCKVIAAED